MRLYLIMLVGTIVSVVPIALWAQRTASKTFEAHNEILRQLP